jgi:hypothetical protein
VPKAAEPIPELNQAPVSVAEQPIQTAQLNGRASESEVVAAPILAPVEPSPRPTPSPALAPSPAPPAPTAAAAASAHPTTTASAAPQPPRSWASLAASNSKKWGPVAQVSETVAPSSSPGSGSLTSAATTPTPSVAAAQQHHGRPSHQKNDPQALTAAQSITTAHCFVKVRVKLISIKTELTCTPICRV